MSTEFTLESLFTNKELERINHYVRGLLGMKSDNKEKENTEIESVNHPSHYNFYDVEVIDMMIKIWGVDETISFCKLNAFKYRMRIGNKETSSDDIKKEKWYLDKVKELESGNNLVSNENDYGYKLPPLPIEPVIGRLYSYNNEIIACVEDIKRKDADIGVEKPCEKCIIRRTNDCLTFSCGGDLRQDGKDVHFEKI